MYISPNIRTTYSFMTSIIEIDDLITFAKNNNLNYLFICDDNMYGTMEFILKCQNNNIKPIIGVSFGQYNLYAKSYLGYQNLLKLVTLKSTKEITLDDLKKFNADLVCILFNLALYENLKNIFSNIYVSSNLDSSLKKISMKEILCLDKNKLEILKYLHMLRDNKTILEDYLFNDDCLPLDNDIYYDNLLELVNMCNIILPKYKLNLPKYTKYNETKGLNEEEYLQSLSISGLSKRLNGTITDIYKKRLLYELDIINKMGFANYFLIVYDFIKYAKNNNILVGPGRGSSCGSLVSFSLGITDVDPIKYNLLFERFLNIERITMPDIDVDFPDDKRELIINYVINKYGIKHVCQITTFGTFGGKMAIRDMGRVLNIPLYTIDELCKLIGSSDNLKEVYLNNLKLKNMVDSDKKLKKLFFLATNIVGLHRHTSIHAAGVIMSDDNLDDIIPLAYNGNMYLSCYESSYLENLGLLKMDFLGLRNLTIIDNAINLINEKKQINLKFNDIPLDDNNTFKVFQKGDTLGIFQFESLGMRKFLKELFPTSFMDIANANAMFRPGPSDNIDLYIKRKNNHKKINYYDIRLEPILKDTYGIIVYQEQIMQIANVMANYSLGEADILRRAMSKKKLDILKQEKEKFINNAIKNGFSSEVSNEVYALILQFASYGFNKSHSVAYSIISYRMAYLKANYPAYFYIAVLNNATMDNDKTKDYLKEIKRYNIKILKPDINKSNDNYILYYNSVILPFTKIKGVSKIIADKIIIARNYGFKDIYDLFTKLINNGITRNIIELLIDSDALSSFGFNHQTLYNNLDNLINYGNLTNDLNEKYVLKPEIEIYEEYDKNILINREKELFGLYLTNHPVYDYKLKEIDIVNIGDVSKYFMKNINVIGMIDYIKEITTKNNEKMAFMTISDEESEIELILFPKIYSLYNDLKKGDIIKVYGKVEKRSEYQIVIAKIWRL